MARTCRLALAAAGVVAGTVMTPALAADLGGACCADLEERVAELEATTARKGNRAVSLRIYGQVNKGLLIWDDGVQSDAFVVDNSLYGSRFGFTGNARIKPGWTAGYTIEFEIDDASAEAVTQGENGDDARLPDNTGNRDLMIRQNHWFIENERLGRISVGHQSAASGGAVELVLSESLRNSSPKIGANFAVQGANGLTLSDFASNLGPGEYDLLRYDSPLIYGFILSASWGENDYADVALRFKKEFNDLRIAAAMAYTWDSQEPGWNFEQFGGSISIAHVPTGLYGAFQSGSRDYEEAALPDSSFWYIQAGIEKKWLPFGLTTVYGEYGAYDDLAFDSSKATRWGLGINQKISGAAMDIYAHGTFWSFDEFTEVGTTFKPEDFSTVLIGSRIQF